MQIDKYLSVVSVISYNSLALILVFTGVANAYDALRITRYAFKAMVDKHQCLCIVVDDGRYLEKLNVIGNADDQNKPLYCSS
jgi:hypothetical protein